MPVLDKKSVGEDYDDEHHSRLVDRQHKKTMMVHQCLHLFP